VEITGILLAFLDIPAELTVEYNRWYDLDHMPEHVAKGDVLAGRRYVATRELRTSPGIEPAAWAGGHPPYLTLYYFGGPLDFAGQEALDGWRTVDRGIVRAGRYWQEGRGTYSGRWRLEAARARPSVLVAPRAVPYLAHRGVIVAAGKAPSADRRGEAVRWWDDVHLVDLFAVPGVLGALRFRAEDPSAGDQLLHVLLCEDPPGEVMERIEAARRGHRATGRYPAYGGVYESTAFLPYERIVPLEYDFDVE